MNGNAYKQLLKPKVRVISDIPSPSSVVVAPPITLPWKIDPFRVSEFIAHESQIPFSTEGKRDEPGHFVQSHASCDDWSLRL